MLDVTLNQLLTFVLFVKTTFITFRKIYTPIPQISNLQSEQEKVSLQGFETDKS